MAVLSYLDFFLTGVQRVALSTAANMCKKLPSDGNMRRKLIQPICVSGWALLQPLRMCGNTVALDQFITKNATLTNEKEVDVHPIKAMKFSVSPVVRVSVQCKVASDLPKSSMMISFVY